MIVNIHGYKGNGENAMYHILRDLFPDEQILSPQIDYDHLGPYEIITGVLGYDVRLPSDVVDRELQDDRAWLMVGSSLGAFVAGALSYKIFRFRHKYAARYPHLPQWAAPPPLLTVLLNPCLLPWQYLPKLGYTGDFPYESYALMFAELARASTDTAWLKKTCILLGNQDETIGHGFCEELFSGKPKGLPHRLDCGHSIAGDQRAIAEVKGIVRKFCETRL
jgi:hypothetical protein